MPERALYQQFTVCTIITDRVQYDAMRVTFDQAGFDEDRCRFEVFDNTGSNVHDPYDVITRAVAGATTPYVIFCHQDVRLDRGDSIEMLLARLRQLDEDQPKWAVVGNAGMDAHGNGAACFTSPSGTFVVGTLPSNVVSLDENLLVVRTESRVGCSPDLDGFHLYGTDLCLNAIERGHSCHVIAFHLTHLSDGNPTSKAFHQSMARFVERWNPRLTLGLIVLPTHRTLRIASSRGVRWLLHRPGIAVRLQARGLALVPKRPFGQSARALTLAPLWVTFAVTVCEALIKGLTRPVRTRVR